ncbi:hypothetical protein H0H93_014230 [Arthromyces matolae]|nr:hypothetical protein H0H93_014230 [Arthromyces matolae]
MPLAGKPPYATDEPDSFYEQSNSAPQRRLRQPSPSNPNDRSSAYNVYNTYLADDHRQSGVGALGLGLLNMSDDDDDDDDDQDNVHKPPSPSKHAALAAATAANAQPQRPSPPLDIVAPKPGYAAPIATLNLARPEPAASPDARRPIVTIQTDSTNPFDDPKPTSPPYHPTSPSPSMLSSSPHPLQPPITPITPIFARPKPTVAFSDSVATPRPPKPIVRGNNEDTLLRSPGEKGDDFWRRFSMVAKVENSKDSSQKTSLWLRNTQDGSHRLSRWVWVTGILILCIIGGAVGLAYHFSHNSPSNQQPTALGGSANEAATATTSSSVSVNANSSTSRHVSPTLTINNRELGARTTSIPVMHKRRLHHI